MAIYTLSDLRKVAPPELQNATDEELVIEYSKDLQRNPQEVASYFGMETGQDMTLGSSAFSSGLDTAQSLYQSSMAYVNEVMGDQEAADARMEKAKQEQLEAYFAGRPELEKFEDLSGWDYLKYVPYQAVKTLPITVGTIAPVVAGAAIGGPAGAAVGLGGVLGSYGLATGSLYQSAYEGYEAGGERPDNLTIGALAVPYTVAERLIPAGAGRILGGTARGTTAAVGSASATAKISLGTAGEALTESAQNELEMLVNPTLSEEEKASRRLNAFTAGAAGGLGLSTTGVVIQKGLGVQEGTDLTAKTTPETETTLLAPATPEVEVEPETTPVIDTIPAPVQEVSVEAQDVQEVILPPNISAEKEELAGQALAPEDRAALELEIERLENAPLELKPQKGVPAREIKRQAREERDARVAKLRKVLENDDVALEAKSDLNSVAGAEAHFINALGVAYKEFFNNLPVADRKALLESFKATGDKGAAKQEFKLSTPEIVQAALKKIGSQRAELLAQYGRLTPAQYTLKPAIEAKPKPKVEVQEKATEVVEQPSTNAKKEVVIQEEVDSGAIDALLEIEQEAVEQAVNKLNADVSSKSKKAKGKVTLGNNVINAVVRMLRNANPDPNANVYVPKTNKIDVEATAEHGEKVQEIYSAAYEVIKAAYAMYNKSANTFKTAEPIADAEGNLLDPDAINSEMARSDEAVEATARAEANYNKMLANAMKKFIRAAGGQKNAQAIINAIKLRNEQSSKNELVNKDLSKATPEGKYEAYISDLGATNTKFPTQRYFDEHIDSMLSSSFARFRDGDLDANEVDVIDGRGIRYSKKVEKDSKYTARLRKAYDKKGFEGILDLVAPQRGGVVTGYQRTITKAIKSTLRAAERAGIKLEVQFLGDEGVNETKPNYNPANNTITLSQTSSPEEILHEMLHAALQWYVTSNPNSEEVSNLSRALDDIFDFDIGSLDIPQEQKAEILEVVNILKDLRQAGNETDAVLELISYGVTLNSFKRMLKIVDGSNSALANNWYSKIDEVWKRLVKLVSKMLGAPDSTANSVLNNSISLLYNAMNTVTKEQFDATRGNPRLDMGLYNPNKNKDAADVNVAGQAKGDVIFSQHSRRNRDQGMVYSILRGMGYFGAVKFTKEKMSSLAETIRQDHPTIQSMVSYVASGFSASGSFSNIVQELKTDKHTPQFIANELAAILKLREPSEVLAIVKYLDGDTTVLDGVKNPEKVRIYADSLLEHFRFLVQTQPKEVREAFENRKFSEALLFINDSSDVAKQGFSARSLASIVKRKGVVIESSDVDANPDLIGQKENGDLDLGGEFFSVTVSPIAGKPYTLVVNKNVYASSQGELPITDGAVTVNTSDTYKITSKGSLSKGYTFEKKTSYKEAMTIEKAERFASAIQNTLAALSHSYALNKFTDAMLKDGLKQGYVAVSEEQLRNEIQGEINEARMQRGKKPVTLSVFDNEAKSKMPSELRKNYTWYKVPDTEQYGAMAGMIVHGPHWMALSDSLDRSALFAGQGDIASTFGNVLSETTRLFKIAKTRYSIGTQITNVASNVSVMIMHDISFSTLVEAGDILTKFLTNADKLKPNQRQVIESFINSGALSGNFSTAEVAQNSFNALKKAYKTEVDTSVMGKVKAAFEFQNGLMRYAKRKGEKFNDAMAEAYAFGDNLFRLASYLKSVSEEMEATGETTITPEISATGAVRAREDFLNYDIDAPLIRAMRQSVLPFVSWTYAVIPVFLRIMATKPHKVVHLLMAYGLIDAAASALAGDDEEKRKLGPEKLDERLFPFGPHAHIRIPFLGETEEDAVYYKLGDYMVPFSMNRTTPNPFMGLDWFPSALAPSGPITSLITIAMAGVDPFTGKSLNDEIDSSAEKSMTRLVKMIDTMLPPGINISNTAELVDILSGKTDIIGRDEDKLHFLMAKVGGLKFAEMNESEEAAWREIRESKVYRDYRAKMAKIEREAIATGLTDYEALIDDLIELQEQMDEEIRKIWKLEDE